MKSSIIVISSDIQSVDNDEQPKGKVVKKAGKRVGYNYIIVKSFKQSLKNDVVKCWYIKSLSNFGVCVIKEGSTGDTKDKQGRDIIDRLKWQQELHVKLQDKIRMPRLLDSFEERGNYYLVMEHIPGRSLHTVLAEKRKEDHYGNGSYKKNKSLVAGYLVSLAQVAELLHKEGIVHRDFTPNNFMIGRKGKVTLIDMELSYSLNLLFPTPAFALGTYGYMSKQQESMQTPTVSEDIFALGAIILLAASGAPPAKLIRESHPDLGEKLRFFIPDQELSALVWRCLDPEEAGRPTATQALTILRQYQGDLIAGVTRPQHVSEPFTLVQIANTVQSAINTLSTPLLVDAERGWFSEKRKPGTDKSKPEKAWFASFNLGAAGIIYTLAAAKQAGWNINASLPFVDKGLGLIASKYIQNIGNATNGLHFGSDGIAVALTAATEAGLIDLAASYSDWTGPLLEKRRSEHGISQGMAGQGMAWLICDRLLSAEAVQQRLQTYTDQLIAAQSPDGCWSSGYHRLKFGRKRKKVNLGLFDGMTGMVAFLLEYGHRYQYRPAVVAAEKGLQWLSRQAQHKQGQVVWQNYRGRRLNFTLAGGAAGIALLFIKAYEYTRQHSYRNLAKGTLRAIPEKIIVSSLSQDNGLSGLGEVYLEAIKVFAEKEWTNRADWIAQVIMHFRKVHPAHGTFWLVEGERKPYANFIEGQCGVLHFLMRYCSPEKIGFPLWPTDL